MKKLSQILIAVALILGPLFVGAAASAEECSITGTGPGSENKCEVSKEFTCEVDIDNKFTVTNSNDQVVASGEAKVEGNTTGGDAGSGTAVNVNGTTIHVTFSNGGCQAAAVTPTPPAGQGAAQGGAGQVVAPAALGLGAAGAVLPNTSSDVAGYVVALAGALGIGLGVFYLITLALRHFNS